MGFLSLRWVSWSHWSGFEQPRPQISSFNWAQFCLTQCGQSLLPFLVSFQGLGMAWRFLDRVLWKGQGLDEVGLVFKCWNLAAWRTTMAHAWGSPRVSKVVPGTGCSLPVPSLWPQGDKGLGLKDRLGTWCSFLFLLIPWLLFWRKIKGVPGHHRCLGLDWAWPGLAASSVQDKLCHKPCASPSSICKRVASPAPQGDVMFRCADRWCEIAAVSGNIELFFFFIVG